MSYKRHFLNNQKTEESYKSRSKNCFPECNLFRCSQRALTIRFDRGKKIPWCNFVPGGDICQGANCNYALCAQHKLKTDNSCGLYINPRNKQSEERENTAEEEKGIWGKQVQFKSKVLRRIRNLSEFE